MRFFVEMQIVECGQTYTIEQYLVLWAALLCFFSVSAHFFNWLRSIPLSASWTHTPVSTSYNTFLDYDMKIRLIKACLAYGTVFVENILKNQNTDEEFWTSTSLEKCVGPPNDGCLQLSGNQLGIFSRFGILQNWDSINFFQYMSKGLLW